MNLFALRYAWVFLLNLHTLRRRFMRLIAHVVAGLCYNPG